jgi:hypothetical protein
MKKMMMMLITVGAVTVAQATSVSWLSVGAAAALLFNGSVAFSTGPTSETASLTAYYMLLSSAGSLTVAGGRTEAALYDVTFALGQTATSGTAAGRLAVPGARVAGNDAGGTAYFARVFVTVGAQDYFFDTATWTSVGGPSSTVQENLSWVGYGGVQTWTAVPEPTSMALLALGVAAIGLRRKFRA